MLKKHLKEHFLISFLSVLLLWTGLVITVFSLQKRQTLEQHAAGFTLPPAIDSSWRLTFDDEFNGSSVDWSKWKDGGTDFGNGGNGEQQQYVPDAFQFANGVLQIRADTRHVNGRNYTSGELNTIGGFKQTYGYFECRAKIPKGKGLWPACWMYSMNGSYEIDAMENLGDNPNVYYMTYHDGSGGQPQKIYTGVDLSADYHIYAVKWTPGLLIFYLDNVEQLRVTKDIYTGPMYYFINLAVGGNWPGSPNSSTQFPSFFDIDYVRIYAMPGDTSNPPIALPTATTTAPTPTKNPPTPTSTPKTTTLLLSLILHGIGNGGDNTNPHATGNKSPQHPQRTATISLYNSQNIPITTAQATITYDPNTGTFKGSATLGGSLSSGAYLVKVKTDQYLQAQVSGIQNIVAEQTNTLPQASLTVGDINGDNQINIVDYNILMGCYSDLLPATNCNPSEHTLSDLNDDGKVNAIDYNLFIRELSTNTGQ